MSQKGSSARHTFYYLLGLLTLGFTALGVGQILFQAINQLLPEAVSSYGSSFDEEVLRFGITSVIIAAPIFYLCTRAINRELAGKTLDLDSLVRKWLTYFILFVVSVTIIGDLMVVLYSFLDGELTMRFILKALVIAGISGLIFGYYLYDISREKFEKNDKKVALYRNIFAIVIILSLVLGFYFNVSPSVSRAQREDQERVSRLQSIHYEVEQYYQENAALPESLEDIQDRLYNDQTMDPVTDEPFAYRTVDQDTYEICADFELSNRDRQQNGRYWANPDWLHDAGEVCFEKTMTITLTPRIEVPLPPSV